eukprot:gene41239-50331_t
MQLLGLALLTLGLAGCDAFLPISSSLATSSNSHSKAGPSALSMVNKSSWFPSLSKKPSVAPVVPIKKYESLTVRPNYNVAFGSLAIGLGALFSQNLIAGAFFALVGVFLTIQTGKIRFLFDNDSFEVLVQRNEDNLEKTRENFAVGGANRWTYDSILDWFFIPSPAFPVLVYFKEKQTKPEGQIHFFPVIMDGQQLFS